MVARPGAVYWLQGLLADEVILMVCLAERRDRSLLDA